MTESELEIQAHNLTLVTDCVTVWLQAVAASKIMAADLWLGPAGLLLAHHHGLQVDADKGVFFRDGEQHPEAYSWWSAALSHVHPNGRTKHPLGELLEDVPVSVKGLVFLEQAFDAAAPTFDGDQNRSEVLFEPETTGIRLVAALDALADQYALEPGAWAHLQARIYDACT